MVEEEIGGESESESDGDGNDNDVIFLDLLEVILPPVVRLRVVIETTKADEIDVSTFTNW